MAKTFDFTPAGGATQESGTEAVAAGQVARVRFEPKIQGDGKAQLKIVGSSTTTYVDIDDNQAWVTDALLDGDVVSVVATMNNSTGSRVAGVLEVG